jgi:hypothetical protein
MEYEFDLVCDMDWSHILSVSKSRCTAVADMKVEKPGPSFLAPVIDWLESGVVQPVSVPFTVPTDASAPAPYTEGVSAPPAITLDTLVERYGVEKIMATNNGLIPGTQEELDLIADVLALSEESV